MWSNNSEKQLAVPSVVQRQTNFKDAMSIHVLADMTKTVLESQLGRY